MKKRRSRSPERRRLDAHVGRHAIPGSQAEQEGGGLAARGGSRRARRGVVGQVAYGAAPRVAGAARNAIT